MGVEGPLQVHLASDWGCNCPRTRLIEPARYGASRHALRAELEQNFDPTDRLACRARPDPGFAPYK
jgi:hypothetical protein